MSVVRLSRLGQVGAALALLLGALLVVDASLSLTLGPAPAWLPMEVGSDVVSAFGRRLARVEQLKASDQVQDENLVAIIGISTVRLGFDARTLAASDPRHRQWVVLGAVGRSIAQLELYTRILSDSNLRPKTVVLGLHEMMLTSGENPFGERSSWKLLPHHLRQRHPGLALADVSWVYSNRGPLASGVLVWLYECARDVRRTFHLPLGSTYEAERDPWCNWGNYTEPHAPPSWTQLQGRAYQLLLQPRNFTSNQRQLAALDRLIAGLRSHQMSVVVLLLPETTSLRSYYPPVVGQQFDQAIAEAGRGQAIPVIDLRTTMADEDFYDKGHVNAVGRQKLSAMTPGRVP